MDEQPTVEQPTDEQTIAPEIRTGSPFREDATPPQESPRLGILHLLVGTACVAVCLGISKLWIALAPEEFRGQFQVMQGLYSLGAGAAVGGLVLWAARRYRGIRFPVYPGETLLMATGALYIVVVVCQLTALAMMHGEEGFGMGVWLPLALYGTRAAVFAWLALRLRGVLWRLYCLGTLVVAVGWVVVLASLRSFLFSFSFWLSALQIFNLSLGGILLLIVLLDLRHPRRYPWSHWLGLAVVLWEVLLSLLWTVWQSVAR